MKENCKPEENAMFTQSIHYITPAVTPLLPDGSLDYASCEKLYRHLVRGGVDGILILGSIGEFFAFPMEEQKKLIPFAKKIIGKDAELIVGTSSMIFDEMVAMSNYALDQGADAVMLLPPYYFHFTGETIVEYYRELAQAIHGNVYLYNFPDRTGYEIPAESVRILAETCPNIIGIKDSVSGMDHTREMIKTIRPLRPDFRIYSGFDDHFVHNILCGGNGCIGGLSNLFPEMTTAWKKAMEGCDWETVRAIQNRVDKIMDIYSVGKPFVPIIKEAMAMQGYIAHATATKPMPKTTEAQKEKLKAILKL